MGNRPRGGTLLLCWLLGAATLTASAAERQVSIEPVEKWSDVFSDSAVTFHYAVRAAAPLEGRLGWSLSVNQRTVEHGEQPFEAAAGQATEVAVALKLPTVKAGVILKSQLSVAVYVPGAQQPAATHSKPLWIFPRDPFADRQQWLKGLRITLFDPQRTTDDVLRQAGVPFQLLSNPAALDAVTEGLLLIGEGTAWRDHRALGESMMKAAARGVPVLCLAPGEGAIVLPGSEGAEQPSPVSLTLRREDIITELDQRLDAVAWPPQGQMAASRLAIKAGREQVLLEVTEDAHGWPWLEVSYPAAKGRLVVCGLAIIRPWESGPAPRYLLAELLTRLSVAKEITPPAAETPSIPSSN